MVLKIIFKILIVDRMVSARALLLFLIIINFNQFSANPIYVSGINSFYLFLEIC